MLSGYTYELIKFKQFLGDGHPYPHCRKELPTAHPSRCFLAMFITINMFTYVTI